MNNVAKDAPDFYLTLGDDFSIERPIKRIKRSTAKRIVQATSCRIPDICA
jgi:hypothetical protein